MAHKKTRPVWVIVVAILAAILVLVALGWLAATKLTDDPDPSTSTLSGEEWDFGPLILSPPEGWERNTEVDGWIDRTNCSATPDDCPKSYVDDLEACETDPPDPFADPYAGTCSMDGDPIELEASRLCGWDKETDGSIEPEEVNVGGETAEFFTFNGCPRGSWSWWYVEGKKVLFSLEDPAGLADPKEITRLLEENVAWTS